MVHGQRDKRIPIGKFYSTKKRLQKNGGIVEFVIIPEGEHTLPSGVYKDVVEWLAKVMK